MRHSFWASRAYSTHTQEYLTKPTQPDIITERIRTILKLSAEQRTMLQHKRMDEQRDTLARIAAPPDKFMQ